MIKADLITGFLGSGKTNFICDYVERLCAEGIKTAVIVKDYGAVNVDRLFLEKRIGRLCHVDMVIAGDADCARRRLKTKLISLAMDHYERVILEPSGIYNADDFLDLIYDDALERWYCPGSIITLVDAGMCGDLGRNARYVLASQAAKAGAIVITKTEKADAGNVLKYDPGKTLSYDKLTDFSPGEAGAETEKLLSFGEAGTEAEKQLSFGEAGAETEKPLSFGEAGTEAEKQLSFGETWAENSLSANEARAGKMKKAEAYVLACLEEFGCKRKDFIFVEKAGQKLDDEKYKLLKNAGYRSGEMQHLSVTADGSFESAFFYRDEDIKSGDTACVTEKSFVGDENYSDKKAVLTEKAYDKNSVFTENAEDKKTVFTAYTRNKEENNTENDPVVELKTKISGIFDDNSYGTVYRVKGFVKIQEGWLEVNAMKNSTEIAYSDIGQAVFIAIGENLNREKLKEAFDFR